MKIWVINGPNLNMLGKREPEIYGNQTYEDLLAFIEESAKELDLETYCFQSNHEGAIIDKIQEALGKAGGIIINPAGYTHTSIAILDALKAVGLPLVEVHLTDPSNREDFRHTSYIATAANKTIKGKGFEGYREAMIFLKSL